MKVKLITSINELPSHLATAICVGKDIDIFNDDSGEIYSYSKGFSKAIKSGHFSVLEHIPFTWYITDVSRVTSHQLVRHRIASYSQQSQRYCKITPNSKWFIIPETIEINPEALQQFNQLMSSIELTYDFLIRQGVPAEDARFILPNACKTKFLVSMNARAFIEAAEQRLCHKAQWEIHELFSQMRHSIQKTFPTIYQLAVPLCAKGGCREKYPCNHPFVSKLPF